MTKRQFVLVVVDRDTGEFTVEGFDRPRRANPMLFAHWRFCHGNGRTSGAV